LGCSRHGFHLCFQHRLFRTIKTGCSLDLTLSCCTRPKYNLDRVDARGPGNNWQEDKGQKAEMTAALRRNLQFAVPDLIHDAQASGGSISTTFKLYKDLTVVCESLDSLLPPGSREGKTELTALGNDLSDMNRLKEELSSYIEQTAGSMESKNARLVSSAGRSPKRVVVDDNIPEKPSPKKRGPSNQ